MSHHSEKPADGNTEFDKLLEEMIQKKEKTLDDLYQQSAKEEGFGKTGKFPDDKLVGHDEGEIIFGITAHEGKVVLNFGTPVAWIGFTPEQARDVGELLIAKSNEIK
jgi:hypothetical protein